MYIQREEGRKIMILIHGREEKRKGSCFPQKDRKLFSMLSLCKEMLRPTLMNVTAHTCFQLKMSPSAM